MKRNDGSHDREREADLTTGNMGINRICKVDSADIHSVTRVMEGLCS